MAITDPEGCDIAEEKGKRAARFCRKRRIARETWRRTPKCAFLSRGTGGDRNMGGKGKSFTQIYEREGGLNFLAEHEGANYEKSPGGGGEKKGSLREGKGGGAYLLTERSERGVHESEKKKKSRGKTFSFLRGKSVSTKGEEGRSAANAKRLGGQRTVLRIQKAR